MTLVPQRRWLLPDHRAVDAPDGIAPLVARILANRGLGTAEMSDFLAARIALGGPPMIDLERSVQRLRRALAARERIVVYGDYDVDGLTGAAILVRAFRQLGVAVAAYIPDRYEEGYGLNAQAIRKLAADGTKVIVSVDCGVTAVKEAELARALGIDLIVTDHHHPPARLPDAYALVNPRRPGDPSLDKELARAGAALALARSLLGELGYALREDELLQLVALATASDRMHGRPSSPIPTGRPASSALRHRASSRTTAVRRSSSRSRATRARARAGASRASTSPRRSTSATTCSSNTAVMRWPP